VPSSLKEPDTLKAAQAQSTSKSIRRSKYHQPAVANISTLNQWLYAEFPRYILADWGIQMSVYEQGTSMVDSDGIEEPLVESFDRIAKMCSVRVVG